MVGGPNVPKTAAEWVRVAIAIRGADEVALVRCDVPAATSPPPPSASPSDASSTDSGIHYDEEGVAYAPMTRLQCMLRALVPHITAASEEGAAVATTNEDMSRYWNMLGGMFTSATPSVDVTVGGGGGGGNGPSETTVTLHPLYCYASAVRLDPSSAPAWNNLGAELAQSPPPAAEEASRIINADSGNVPPISVSYCFARAVELRPSHVGAWFNVCLGDSSVELRLPSSPHWMAGTATTAPTDASSSPSSSKLKHSVLTVTREDCFVKALTAAREESYSLFLTGKSLLELPASRGGHFARPFCVESAIVAALDEALAFEAWERAAGTVTNSAAPTPSRDAGALSLDTVALWYYAAECVEYTVNHNYSSPPPSSPPSASSASSDSDAGKGNGGSANEVARTIAVGGQRYTAQQCLVAALEAVAEKQRVLLDRHSGTNRAGANVSVSPFTPLVWEALAKHVKGEDATVTIAGRSFSAEEVFTNQFET